MALERRAVGKLLTYGSIASFCQILAIVAFDSHRKSGAFFFVGLYCLFQAAFIASVLSLAAAWLGVLNSMDPPGSIAPGESSWRTVQLAANTRVMFLWLAGLSLLYPVLVTPQDAMSWRIILGIVLGLLGMFWRSAAIIYRSQHSGLLTGGPYAVMRHPRYVGTVIAFLGLACAVSPFYIGAAPVAALIGSHWVSSIKEERDLKHEYGDSYRTYAKRVRAVLPHVAVIPFALDDVDVGIAVKTPKILNRLLMTWVPGLLFIAVFVTRLRIRQKTGQ